MQLPHQACSKVPSATTVGRVLVFDSVEGYHPRNGVCVGVRPHRGTCVGVGPQIWCLGWPTTTLPEVGLGWYPFTTSPDGVRPHPRDCVGGRPLHTSVFWGGNLRLFVCVLLFPRPKSKIEDETPQIVLGEGTILRGFILYFGFWMWADYKPN